MLQQTKGGHCLGPARVQRKPSRAYSVVMDLQLHFFHSKNLFLLKLLCFYGCSLWMPGAPEILQFNSRVNSVCLSGGFQRHLPHNGEGSHHCMRIGHTRSLQQRFKRGALEGPIQGWPYLTLNQYLVSLLTLWAVTSLDDWHVRVAEAVMCNSCNFIVDKLNLKLSRASLKGDWLDG